MHSGRAPALAPHSHLGRSHQTGVQSQRMSHRKGVLIVGTSFDWDRFHPLNRKAMRLDMLLCCLCIFFGVRASLHPRAARMLSIFAPLHGLSTIASVTGGRHRQPLASGLIFVLSSDVHHRVVSHPHA